MMSASLVGSESREEAELPMFDVLLDEEPPMLERKDGCEVEVSGTEAVGCPKCLS